MKEFSTNQYHHLEEIVKETERLKFIEKVNPKSALAERTKKKIFGHYYKATRTVKRVNGELSITVDKEMVQGLKTKI